MRYGTARIADTIDAALHNMMKPRPGIKRENVFSCHSMV
ncbi:hypothetical protein [Azospirillum argentinense]|uniref:Uncharacterized protein n=1 Tax=Azospirillum argentinense TaxID=2970906 RepID=A0A5B0KXX6_9PROT|nr:hypothetical protein FH063_004418 [Azospirillum argentinense]